MTIRDSTDADLPALRALYPAAFPDEDLVPLMSDLLTLEDEVVSLVVEDGAGLIGHVVLTLFEAPPARGALLGPLAIAPEHQRQGHGSSLLSYSADRVAALGCAEILLLGDPAYYSRAGYRRAAPELMPYPMPPGWEAAWQSLRLRDRAPLPRRPIVLPDPWMRPEYWGPTQTQDPGGQPG